MDLHLGDAEGQTRWAALLWPNDLKRPVAAGLDPEMEHTALVELDGVAEAPPLH